MKSRDVLAFLSAKVRAFRKTPWFRVVYLVVLGALVAQLYVLTASPIACLILFLMPITVFLIPFYLGERRGRHFALNAVPVFVIATLLAAGMQSQALLSLNEAIPLAGPPDFSIPSMALTDGNVTPYRSDPGRAFAFRVKLTTSDNGTPEDFDVYLNLTVINGIAAAESGFLMNVSAGPDSSPNTLNGTWYEYNATLGGSIYAYGFSATDGGNWTYTASDFGPLTASGVAFYGFFLYFTALSMTVPLLFYFLILFMWWYMGRSRANRMRMLDAAARIPEDTSTSKPAEPVGKAAKAAAFTCTNCGADVSDADEKCPKCGAVFED